MDSEHDPFGWYVDVPLIAQNNFRVLALHGLQEGQDSSTDIDCELRTISLDDSDHPRYVALSYTWSNPIRTVDLSTALSTEDGLDTAIFCHGRRLPIGNNLHAALVTFRETRVGLINGFYLWVDAICINQNDVQERANQVCFMGEIYSHAFMVLVWLGEEDECSRVAMSLIKSFCVSLENCEEDWTELCQEAGTMSLGNESIWARLKVTPFEKTQWRAINAFFARKWFLRLWTLQEILFTQTAAVYCGETTLPLRDLQLFILFLLDSNWMKLLTLDADPRALNDEAEFGFLGGLTLIEMFGFRGGFERTDPYDWQRRPLTIGEGFAESLEMLLLSGSQREASDPRDYVYANLSLAMQCRKTPTEESIVPDYRKSVQQIYVETTKFLVRSTRSLNIITYARQREYASLRDPSLIVSGLPTWVPQYDQILEKSLAYKPTDSENHSALGICHTASNHSDTDSLLNVKGFAFHVARFWATDTREFVPAFLKSVDIFYATVNALDKTTFLELWMRTLLNAQPPGEVASVYGTHFVRDFVNFDDLLNHTRVALLASLVFWILNQTEADLGLDDGNFFEDSSNVPPELELIMRWFRDNPQVRLAMHGQPFLDPEQLRDRAQEAIRAKIDSPIQWTIIENYLRVALEGTKGLFCTQDHNMLGVVYVDFEQDDELWFLHGLDVPVLLRRSSDPDLYTFVGEVFIAGYIDGEILGTGWTNGRERSITLR